MVAIAGFALIATSLAQANLIVDSHTITASGPDTVGFTYFSLSATDDVSLRTEGPSLDAVMYLLRDDGELTVDDFVSYDDDSCPFSVCGVSGGFGNAQIAVHLAAGSYVVAVGDFAVSLADVVNGISTGNTAFGIMTGVVETVIDAPTATVSLRSVSVSAPTIAAVPEPQSLALFGLATVALWFFVGRKKR